MQLHVIPIVVSVCHSHEYVEVEAMQMVEVVASYSPDHMEQHQVDDTTMAMVQPEVGKLMDTSTYALAASTWTSTWVEMDGE